MSPAEHTNTNEEDMTDIKRIENMSRDELQRLATTAMEQEDWKALFRIASSKLQSEFNFPLHVTDQMVLGVIPDGYDHDGELEIRDQDGDFTLPNRLSVDMVEAAGSEVTKLPSRFRVEEGADFRDADLTEIGPNSYFWGHNNFSGSNLTKIREGCVFYYAEMENTPLRELPEDIIIKDSIYLPAEFDRERVPQTLLDSKAEVYIGGEKI